LALSGVAAVALADPATCEGGRAGTWRQHLPRRRSARMFCREASQTGREQRGPLVGGQRLRHALRAATGNGGPASGMAIFRPCQGWSVWSDVLCRISFAGMLAFGPDQSPVQSEQRKSPGQPIAVKRDHGGAGIGATASRIRNRFSRSRALPDLVREGMFPLHSPYAPGMVARTPFA